MTHLSSRRAALTLRLALLAPLAALLPAGAAAQAEEPRLYAGAHLALSHLQSWPARVAFGNGVAADGRLGLGDRLQGSLFIGRQKGPQRWEVEAVAGQQSLRRIELASQQADAAGNVRYQAVLINAVRHASWSEQGSAYAGLGLGWGRVDLPAAGFGARGCACFAESSGSGAVVQVRVGLEAVLARGSRAFVQAGALRLPAAGGASVPAGPSVSYPRRDVLSLGVGYRHDF